MERPEPPENVKNGDESLQQRDPATAQAHYLRQIALALTDIAQVLVEEHVAKAHPHEHARGSR